jgi:heme exporter protein C
MKNNWWKYLAAILLIYAIVAGMLRPLNPGILTIAPFSIQSGTTQDFTVATYNTNFTANDDIKAYVKINDTFGIQNTKLEVLAPNQLKVTFDVPELLPQVLKRNGYSLIIDSPKQGAFIRPNAISIVQKNIDLEAAIAAWPQNNYGEFTQVDKAQFPFRTILYESIRNLFYHVPMWFGMTFLLMGSLVFAIRYLIDNKPAYDIYSKSLIKIAVLYGVLGCVTGSIWARGTWGTWWTFQEVKLTVSAVALLLYFAYFLLRSAIDDETTRARISAIYNIIGFVATIFLLFVLPRMVESSLHPGNGGNPGFGGEDLDNTLRTVFYPAVIGWTLFGFWLAQLAYRTELLEYYFLEKYD